MSQCTIVTVDGFAVYGLKTKDEANTMVCKWISDIADIRDRHRLETIHSYKSETMLSWSDLKVWASRCITMMVRLRMSSDKMDYRNHQSIR
jgi:hypothetical protein